ncbi:hypothetical protein COB57_06100 [Candidatus Peregrinibacteria bacterium]|nr:MAG: hypothetical protein COB57_06100 [Candidatus Peregrinibacteria bacterium]
MKRAKSIQCKNIGLVRENADNQSSLEVLLDINMEIHQSEFISIIGPSGCGKSTLIDIISGFLKPTSGTADVDGCDPVILLKDNKGHPRISRIFQEKILFPWLTVTQNIIFGMKRNNFSKSLIQSRLSEIIHKVGLSEYAEYYPHQLSGGMKQRVAIARALSVDSDYILMDEPFTALDYQTRKSMHDFLLYIWKEFDKTIILITHDINEAILLSDRILLMSSIPSTITEEMTINMPRPRDETCVTFNNYKKRIIEHLERFSVTPTTHYTPTP